MLTNAQYTNLWTAPAPNGFGQAGTLPPSYREYVQREIYFQDYLDLFIGTMTYPRVNFGGVEYVQITNTNLATKGIAIIFPYCYTNAGIDYIKVDYSYPWNYNQLTQKKCIKYIMIGEAAPAPNPVIPPGPNDNQNSYFYDVNHTKNTGYFTAPCTAFNVAVANKAIRLFNLAMQGVVLIDIFPFAVSYSTDFREFLNNNIITEIFGLDYHSLWMIELLP